MLNQVVKKRVICITLVLMGLIPPMSYGQSPFGSIAGTVTDPDGHPLANADIVIQERNETAVSDSKGAFRLSHVRPGSVSLAILCIGREPATIHDVLVQAGRTTVVTIRLAERLLPMEDMTVTPGHFSIAQGPSSRRQAIEKERITAMPATLDDIYRVLQVMPGVSFSDDYSAHLHVRGGKQNENLILLDGIEIYDPYHLKDLGGAVGVMNMDLVDNLSIMTGGFEAKYGDRLSSVVSIENRTSRSERFSGHVSAGGTGLALLLETPFPHGSAIASVRKSLLKEAAEFLNPTDYTFSPSFYDLQSKITLSLSENNQLYYNFLYSRDRSFLEQWRGASDIHADYGNCYQGLVWKSRIHSTVSSECIISQGTNFWDNRVGRTKEEKLDLQETTCLWNGKAWFHRRHETSLGLSYKDIAYSYEVETEELSSHQQELEDLVQSYFGTRTISPRTWKLAAYIQDQVQLAAPFFLNVGLRYDYFEYNNDRQISPRCGLSYHLKSKTILRAAWGKYYQAPIYAELTNQKGAEHNPKAQESTHFVLGVEHFFSESLSLRIEAYQKSLQRMIGHYFEIDEQTGLPALHYGNPHSGMARGVEFFVNGKVTSSVSIWAAYAYSKTVLETFFVNWQSLHIEKQTLPRFTDQPHNLSLYVHCRLPRSWELNVKWRYLSGIPYTPMIPQSAWGGAVWEYGDYYSARYPAYHRMDVRIGKNFKIEKHRLAAFLEVKNLYNQKNILLYDYRIQNGSPVRKAYTTLPFLPTIEFKLFF